MKIQLLLILISCLFLACATPMAKFGYMQNSDEVPSKVKFLNESKNADEQLWDFGDGNTSNEMSPEHKFTKSGRYNIKLVVTKGNKRDEMEKEIFFNAPKECLVRMQTSEGSLTFKLSDDTPLHRDNFVKLVKEGYYEDVLFHRVIRNFMVQGGDPNSKGADKNTSLGSGGPGYQVNAEFVDNLYHVKGALAAARQGDQVNPEKKSSGSQFYVVHGNDVSPELLDRIEGQKGFTYPDEIKEEYLERGGTPFLDRDYTVFGVLVEGFEVLDAIANNQTDGRDRPIEDVKIISTELVK
jgi:peptidyl-prolyl cis-trans isomerase B (cyclophilin B)